MISYLLAILELKHAVSAKKGWHILKKGNEIYIQITYGFVVLIFPKIFSKSLKSLTNKKFIFIKMATQNSFYGVICVIYYST